MLGGGFPPEFSGQSLLIYLWIQTWHSWDSQTWIYNTKLLEFKTGCMKGLEGCTQTIGFRLNFHAVFLAHHDLHDVMRSISGRLSCWKGLSLLDLKVFSFTKPFVVFSPKSNPTVAVGASVHPVWDVWRCSWIWGSCYQVLTRFRRTPSHTITTPRSDNPPKRVKSDIWS